MSKNTLLSRLLPVTALVLLGAALIPAMGMAAGGNAEDPATEQLKTYIVDYQLCFFKALPQAMADLDDNTPDEALADRALDLCNGQLESLRQELATRWEDGGAADVAVKEIRETTRELALEDFARARELYPKALEMMREHKDAQQNP